MKSARGLAAVLGVTAFVLLGRPAWADTLSAAQVAAIDAVVAQQMSAQHVPGISVAVERDGQVLYAHGYGERDVAAQKPPDAGTYFEIGSITKQFTATSIAMLVNDGKVRFDDRVATYLPDVPHASEITIQELLNHTSGLADYTSVPGVVPMLHSTTAKPADLYGLVAGLPLTFAPGTQFEYSNTNYAVLGAIIERVSGMTYAAFLRKRVLDGTSFAGISYGVPAGKSVAFGYDAAAPTKPLSIWSSNVTYAAGALYATPTDLVHWDDAFFNGRVVAPAMVKRLTTPPALPFAKKSTYAAGWIAEAIDGHPEIWHNGGLPGFNTRNAYFPDQHLAIAVFGNIVSFDGTSITRGILRTFVLPTSAQLAAESTSAPGEDPAITARMREQWNEVVKGHVDPNLYDPTVAANLPDVAVAQVGAGLAKLGSPTAFLFVQKIVAPLGVAYVYRVVTPNGDVQMTLSISPQDKINGIYFKPE
jgi:D-alanyl-D-alanine carboxypeptidase